MYLIITNRNVVVYTFPAVVIDCTNIISLSVKVELIILSAEKASAHNNDRPCRCMCMNYVVATRSTNHSFKVKIIIIVDL